MSEEKRSVRSGATIVPDGGTRRRICHLYATGRDVADIAAQTGVDRETVGELLSTLSYSRQRAAQFVRDYDAVHGTPPVRPAHGQDLVTAIRVAVRAELAPLVAAVNRAAERTTVSRPVSTTAAVDGLAEQVTALADEVRRLTAPAPPAVNHGEVLDRWDSWQCAACGSRYRYRATGHPCGELMPVTVTITARAETG